MPFGGKKYIGKFFHKERKIKGNETKSCAKTCYQGKKQIKDLFHPFMIRKIPSSVREKNGQNKEEDKEGMTQNFSGSVRKHCKKNKSFFFKFFLIHDKILSFCFFLPLLQYFT